MRLFITVSTELTSLKENQMNVLNLELMNVLDMLVEVTGEEYRENIYDVLHTYVLPVYEDNILIGVDSE